jgi:hypothetical protein
MRRLTTVLCILFECLAAFHRATVAGDLAPGSPCPRPKYLVIHDGYAFRKIQGRLITRGSEHTIGPVTRAQFLYADSADDPKGNRPHMELKSTGEFVVVVGIPWWKHDYCENGVIVTAEGIGRQKILVRMKGCVDYIFTVGENWTSRDLELVCSKAKAG